MTADMAETLLTHETALRLGTFLAVFAAIAVAERFRPAARSPEPLWRRWGRNLGLLALSTLVLRLLFPILAVGAALSAAARGIGLFNWLDWPLWLEWALTILLLDGLLYGQHRLLHAVPLLWRLHRTHHIDRHLDVTTGGRFHPLEMMLSMMMKMLVVFALGAPAAAVLLFEVILNAAALFTHGNLRLPPALDAGLRRVMVTPAMHRIHHAEAISDMSRNFGFALSLWDRVFGSYRGEPSVALVIGEAHRRAPADGTLAALLSDPFKPEVPQ